MAGRVMEWTAQERTHAVVLLLATALYGAHYLVWCWPQPWFIEDAAITFSYSRNWVDGEGLVAYPGGEPVEGYSNPLWMVLLAGFYAVRLDPWVMAKVLGFVFGAATLPFVYALGRRARPGPLDAAPLVAPLLLAASTQFVLWNCSGLENSLFSFLLASGTWRLAVEIQEGRRRPWSALLFFALTITRPDGLMYAAVALLARIVGSIRNRQWGALPAWIALFAAPFAAYHAVRYQYFGWEFPNTYYAKQRTTNLLGWAAGGWKQFREYSRFYLFLYTTPMVAMALVGWDGADDPQPRWRWRRAVVVGLCLMFGVLVGWDGRAGVPDFASAWWTSHVANDWSAITVWFLLVASVIMGVLTLIGPGWEVRAVLWASWCAGVFFWVWSGVEWMKGYRWGSLLAVPLLTLVALGLGTWVRRIPLVATVALAGVYACVAPKMPTLPWDAAKKPLLQLGVTLVTPDLWVQWVALLAVALLLMLAAWWWEGRGRLPLPARPLFHLVLVAVVLVIPNIAGSWEYAYSPETSPNSVHRRVNYMKKVQARLGLEEVTLLDVDMGAHMWWASDWTIGDMAGLVDVPMSRHIKYPKPFIDDYVFGELRPDFAHVHGSWAKTTKIPQNPKWKEQYIEIPGYSSGGKALHVGNHVRRDHMVGLRYLGPEGRQVLFDGGVILEGWEVPAPMVASGGKLYVDSTWRVLNKRASFRVLVFLADANGHLHSAEVAPGYDWYRPDSWKPGEYVYGRWSVPIPEGLAPGHYDLGFVVIDQATGAVLPPTPESLGGAAPADPRFMVGELLLPAGITVGTVDQATAAADRIYDGALTAATNGDCDGAQRGFLTARRHVARNEQWWKNRLDAMNAARIGCLIRQAEGLDDLVGRANVLTRARRIDHHNLALIAVCTPLGEELERLGDEARDAGKWQAAYERYRAAVSVVPTRVWARRKAEEARDHRLGLVNGVEKAKPRPTPVKNPKKPAGTSPPAEPEPDAPKSEEPERDPEG